MIAARAASNGSGTVDESAIDAATVATVGGSCRRFIVQRMKLLRCLFQCSALQYCVGLVFVFRDNESLRLAEAVDHHGLYLLSGRITTKVIHVDTCNGKQFRIQHCGV